MVYDRDGLLLAKVRRNEGGSPVVVKGAASERDMVLGAVTSIVEPTLRRIKEYETGTFGTGTFESEDYRLVFSEAGPLAILLTITPYDVDLGSVMPHAFLVAEKVANVLAGKLFERKQSLDVPSFQFDVGTDWTDKKRISAKGETLRFKVILLGDDRVGKTSLVEQFVTNRFTRDYRPTLGVAISEQEFFLQGLEDGGRVEFVIYDLAGQQFFKRVRHQYYLGVDAAFVVFDLTHLEMFAHVTDWVDDLWERHPDTPVVLVGNKVDLEAEREVEFEEADRIAQKYHAPYLETSAKTGQNVYDAFQMVAIGLFFKHWKKKK